MDKKTIRIAKKFALKIRKLFDIKKFILFGSRARGDHFEKSDFDFIVVSDDFASTDFTQRISELLKYWDEKTDVEPLCYTVEEFDRKKKYGLVKKALKEGIAF